MGPSVCATRSTEHPLGRLPHQGGKVHFYVCSGEGDAATTEDDIALGPSVAVVQWSVKWWEKRMGVWVWRSINMMPNQSLL